MLNGTIHLQELDIAIIKATNHNKVPPKEKHVRSTPSTPSGGMRCDHLLAARPN